MGPVPVCVHHRPCIVLRLTHGQRSQMLSVTVFSEISYNIIASTSSIYVYVYIIPWPLLCLCTYMHLTLPLSASLCLSPLHPPHSEFCICMVTVQSRNGPIRNSVLPNHMSDLSNFIGLESRYDIHTYECVYMQTQDAGCILLQCVYGVVSVSKMCNSM